MKRHPFAVIAICCWLVACCATSHAGEAPGRASKGQTVYVPAYSHIYHGNREAALLLAVTLSIRNISPQRTLTITAVDYYDTKGAVVRKFLDKPLLLGPLGSERFVVPENDTAGGSGANFIVKWHSSEPISAPIIESIMIGTQNQLGVSFTSRGEPVSQ